MAQNNFDPPSSFVPPDEPPLTPGADELEAENNQLVQKSHAHALEMIANLNLEAVAELVTESKVWGTIWRGARMRSRKDEHEFRHEGSM